MTMAKKETKSTQHGGMHLTKYPVSILGVVGVAALTILGVIVIGIASTLWYHISPAFRMALAFVMVIASQASIAMAMLRGWQGHILGEAIAVGHILLVSVAVAIARQTFYVGWDVPTFLAICSVLTVPVIYLLRSVAALVIYTIAVIVWAFSGGPINAWGGTGFAWILLGVLVPFYGVLQHTKEEVRLAVYSWVMTITVFLVLALTAIDTDYIPFLLMGTLAVTLMLTGYSIDIRKAWGVPFRWFGRFAAIMALIISTVPGSWDGIAHIDGFHWTETLVVVLLILAIMALLFKGVKKRLWSPLLYSGIPIVLGAETTMVRSELYSSVPLIVSFLYVLALGFFEIGQGYQGGNRNHMRFGAAALLGLVIALFIGGGFSPLIPCVVIVILALIIIQVRRTSNHRKDSRETSRRRLSIRHKETTLHSPHKKRKRSHTPHVPSEPPVDAAAEPDASVMEDLPQWMQDMAAEEAQERHDDAIAPEQTRMGRTVVVAPEPEVSQFKAPVFHDPDEIPLPHIDPAIKETKKERAVESRRPGTSPWSTMESKKKVKRPASPSPWSTEGDKRK